MKMMAAVVLLLVLFGIAAALLIQPSNSSPATVLAETPKKGVKTKMPKVEKTDEEWRNQLTAEQYHVLREKGTERPGTGKYWNLKDNGSYECAGCGTELFKSDTKFDSGCGWPSFYDAPDKSKIEFHDDNSFGMHRVEVTCANCGGHLGHVFPDGPQPTGQRYCINSASLKFKKSEP